MARDVTAIASPVAGRPRVVLICHREDRLDAEGLATWLATSFNLVGMVELRERPWRVLKRARREIRRVGLLGFADVLAFRAYYRLVHAGRDRRWLDGEVARLRARYPADLQQVPRLAAANPNT